MAPTDRPSFEESRWKIIFGLSLIQPAIKNLDLFSFIIYFIVYFIVYWREIAAFFGLFCPFAV